MKPVANDRFRSKYAATATTAGKYIIPKPIPPITPYVIINILTLVLKVDKTKAQLARTLPPMHTLRHPYLFARADTTGPQK